MFFLAVGIVSLSLLINYGVSSLRRRAENARLAAEYSQPLEQHSEEAAAVPNRTAVMPARTMEIPSLKAAYRSMDGKASSKMQRLYEQNSDLVGWLYIPGVVDLPVVYRDNEYYLTHNFKKRQDKGGTLFLDENHPLTEATQNLVIHGHNMYDSSMFGILSSYNHLPVVRSNAFASFSTLYAEEEYVVFAVVQVDPNLSSSEYFNYIGRPRFEREEDFYRYTDEIIRRSMFSIPIDVLPSDSILTLATCIKDDRLIVVLRGIREGETKQQLQQLVDQSYMN
jgi:sortase B